jgi:hypothetical protein
MPAAEVWFWLQRQWDLLTAAKSGDDVAQVQQLLGERESTSTAGMRWAFSHCGSVLPGWEWTSKCMDEVGALTLWECTAGMGMGVNCIDEARVLT